MLHLVGHRDEAAYDVAHARTHGGARVPNRARPKGGVALGHVHRTSEVLKVGAAALREARRAREWAGGTEVLPARWLQHAEVRSRSQWRHLKARCVRESNREGEESVIDVDVGARVGGVVLEYGDQVCAQLLRLGQQLGEEL